MRQPRTRNYTKNCAQCGKDFLAYHENYQVYCSMLCNSRARNARAKTAVYMAAYREVNAEKLRHQQRVKSLMRKFNMTHETYDAMLQSQGGVCAICEQKDSDRSLAVDHSHTTGRIRGLLCKRCNHVLGKVNDDSTLLLKCAQYLESWTAQPVGV